MQGVVPLGLVMGVPVRAVDELDYECVVLYFLPVIKLNADTFHNTNLKNIVIRLFLNCCHSFLSLIYMY